MSSSAKHVQSLMSSWYGVQKCQVTDESTYCDSVEVGPRCCRDSREDIAESSKNSFRQRCRDKHKAHCWAHYVHEGLYLIRKSPLVPQKNIYFIQNNPLNKSGENFRGDSHMQLSSMHIICCKLSLAVSAH
jgi:hypothetical protein